MKIGTEAHTEHKVPLSNQEAFSGFKNNDIHDLKDQDNKEFEGDLLLTLSERRRRLIEVEQTSPFVVLEVVNKINLPLGAKIKITSTGINNSLRDEKDGIVYFGCFNNYMDDKMVSSIIINIFLINGK